MGRGQRLLWRQLLQGTGGGLPRAPAWMETGLLISNFLLILSGAAEVSWPRGGRSWPCIGEGRRADRHPSEGSDNAGFLLPSMRTLRGTTPAMPEDLVWLRPGLGLLPPKQMRPPCQADTRCPVLPVTGATGDGLSAGRG